MGGYNFGGLAINNITESEYKELNRARRMHLYDKYKIVITTDRCDDDNLGELMNYPERGKKVATFYFHTPQLLDLILKAFEGHFYQTIELETFERKGSGVVDDLVYEDWWDDECGQVCEYCFLRKNTGKENFECKKGL